MFRPISFMMLLYGLLVLLLAIVGYTAGSSISFFLGAPSGVIVILCALGMLQGWRIADLFALFFVILLTGVFAVRFSQSLGFVPGAMTILSAAMLVSVVIKLLKINPVE